MSKTEHTKGEWMQSEFNPQNIVTSKDPMKSTTICILSGNAHTDKEIAANRKLIAAAPELLETLIGIINRNEARKVNNLIPMDIALIKAAIKKATE